MGSNRNLRYVFFLLMAGGAFAVTDLLLGGMPSRQRATVPAESSAIHGDRDVSSQSPSVPSDTADFGKRSSAPLSPVARSVPKSAQPEANLSTEPFPLVAVPVRDVIASYRQRAKAGDARAACWLGRRLAECGVLDSSPAAIAHSAEMKLAQARALNEDEERALDQLRPMFVRMERCRGLTTADYREAYPLLRQAAVAGSSDALATLADTFSALGPGMPNPSDFRQYSVERDAVLWSGMLAGNTKSFNVLTGLSSPHGIGLQSYDARGEPISRERVGILAEVLARLRQRVEQAHPDLHLGMATANRDSPANSAMILTPEQDRRVNDLVTQIFERGWSDAARVKARNKVRPMIRFDDDCEDFDATFDPALSLSKAVPE
ncbi:hypothetical protein [Ahniella affigens]|uniref:hypothetical protein n=1 Tax=Ahniella affigens TaxID=2021234 RepID=UPI0011B223B6|nr:hypothetical protein [Ahniella affigens]